MLYCICYHFLDNITYSNAARKPAPGAKRHVAASDGFRKSKLSPKQGRDAYLPDDL